MHGLLYLFLLLRGDVSSDCFRGPFNGFGGHFQTSQQLHVLAPLVERRCLAHHGKHAADARRKLGILYIQFLVSRELTVMTVRAKIVGA